MADDPLGISCGARSIIQTDGVPFIFRHDPFKIRSSFFQKVFIVEASEPFSPVSFRIVDVDHQQILSGNRQCFPDDRGKLGVGEEDLGFAMLQDVTDGRSVQPDIEGVQHRAGHRHSKMGLEHLRGVRRHHRNGISPADPPAVQCRSQTQAALPKIPVSDALASMDDCCFVRINSGGAFQ